MEPLTSFNVPNQLYQCTLSPVYNVHTHLCTVCSHSPLSMYLITLVNVPAHPFVMYLIILIHVPSHLYPMYSLTSSVELLTSFNVPNHLHQCTLSPESHILTDLYQLRIGNSTTELTLILLLLHCQDEEYSSLFSDNYV
jgi:hypothetical protein